MANIVREDQENLTALVTVSLAKDDYEPKVDSELKKLRKKLRVKGFRQGKTPLSYIKKLYGQKVLVEEVNNVLNDQLNAYLKDNKLDILGQPMPVVDQLPDLNINSVSDISFKYELGLVPEFEIQGLGEDNEVKGYSVTLDEAFIEREINRIRKQGGEQSLAEDIKENDLLSLDIVELEGDVPKEGGLEKTISTAVDLINNEELKNQLLKLKKDDSFTLNINDLEDRKPEDIRKFILGLSDDDPETGDLFKATVKEIRRTELAELDQELFDKVFGPGEVGSEETLRVKLEEDFKKYYESQSDGKLYGSIQEHLMEENSFELPDDFLKRWLKISNEKLTEDQINEEYETFSKNLKWRLISGKLFEMFDIEVSKNELKQSFEDNVRAYFHQAVDDEMLKHFTEQMMSDENSVQKRHEELLAEKLFANLKEKVKVTRETIGWKAFDELLSQ